MFDIVKLTKKIAVALFIVIVMLVFNPFGCVGTTERGVRTFFGAVQGDETLMPGVHWKVPFFGGIEKRNITPNETRVLIQLNKNAAVSQDTQEIGVKASVFWKYDDTRIPEIVRSYLKGDIDIMVGQAAMEGIKAVIGQYTVFELGKNTAIISREALGMLGGKIKLPVEIIDIMLSDFDWSAAVDQIVEQKITAMASVDKAKAEADRAEQEQRKLSIEAEAQARADIARAEGRKQAALADADAKRAEGQALADYNRMILPYYQMEVSLREIEIKKIEAGKWNGWRVSHYIPLTPSGSMVALPANGP
jgi:regulator of protease activity HflC (stomatin/prohibitin superfamily)